MVNATEAAPFAPETVSRNPTYLETILPPEYAAASVWPEIVMRFGTSFSTLPISRRISRM